MPKSELYRHISAMCRGGAAAGESKQAELCNSDRQHVTRNVTQRPCHGAVAKLGKVPRLERVRLRSSLTWPLTDFVVPLTPSLLFYSYFIFILLRSLPVLNLLHSQPTHLPSQPRTFLSHNTASSVPLLPDLRRRIVLSLAPLHRFRSEYVNPDRSPCASRDARCAIYRRS